MGLLVSLAPPLRAAACNDADQCMGGLAAMWTEAPAAAYQVSTTIQWECLESSAGADSTIGLEASGHMSSVDFVRFGFMSGRAVNGNVYSKEWYSARRMGSVIQHFILRDRMQKPSRFKDYRIMIRYDGADWTYYLGNTIVGTFSGPDQGLIDFFFTGGHVGYSGNANTGRSSAASYQEWGENFFRPLSGFTISDSPFRPPLGNVSGTATSESHIRYNPPTGCN